MVRFSRSIEQQKHFIIVKLTVWVWCGVAIVNGQIDYMVRFSRSIEQQKHFIIVKLTVWVWCGVAIVNGQIDKCLQRLVNKSLTW